MTEKTKTDDIRIGFINRMSFNEPMGIGYLSSYIKKCYPGIKIELFDPRINSIDEIKSFKPSLLLYSVMTGQHKEYAAINSNLKKYLGPFVAIFGGAHPTYFPEFISTDGVDVICRGEGEIALKKIIECMIEGVGIYNINNLWVKKAGRIYKNDVANLIDDLDSIPFPDRDLLYQKSSFLRNFGRKSVGTSRGCPFRCSYCYNSGINKLYGGKKRVSRQRSPENVVDEISDIRLKYNLKFILFFEDVFAGVDIEWLKEFEKRYAKIKIPYLINIRPELVSAPLAKYLRKSGCVSVSMAIEHGNYEYRKKYLFRNYTNERVSEATKIMESAGIRVASQIMLGLPFTKIDDDLESLKLMCKTGPTHATTTIYQPYPGTALADLCVKHELIDRDTIDNLKQTFFSPPGIKNIDYKKVLKLHNNFTLLKVGNKKFALDVEKWYHKLPDCFFVTILNFMLKYLTFRKIMAFERGPLEALREACSALISGVFGFTLRGKRCKL